MFLKPPDNLTPFAKHLYMKPGPENLLEEVKGKQLCDLFNLAESDFFIEKAPLMIESQIDFIECFLL